MSALLATLPLQLVCQLIVQEGPSLSDTNLAVTQPPLQLQPGKLPPGINAVRLATLPLQLVCELLVVNNPAVTENGTLVEFERTQQTPASLPEGYVKFPEDHAAYKIHQEYLTWFEARDRCVSEGGHLAIPDSVDKIVHINGLKRTRRKWLHVGIHKSNVTDEWIRVDNGLVIKSVPWAVDNPDNNGDCVGISILGNGLVNYRCDRDGEFYVCEIPI